MESNEKELRELAKRRVDAQVGFIVHLVMYLVGNAGLIVIWKLTGAHYPWFVWPLFGWGIGIVGHALSLVWGPGSAREQRALDRELRRLRGSHT